MRALRGLCGLGLAAALAACATLPPPAEIPHESLPRPRPRAEPTQPVTPPPQNQPAPLAWSDLPGWEAEDHLAALAAVRAACRVRHNPDLGRVCRALSASPPRDDREARAFLETSFSPEPDPGDGLLTGYFAPQYEARQSPEPPFTAPVRARPDAMDLLLASVLDAPMDRDQPADQDIPTAPDRAGIDAMPADGALAWMRPEDLFFMQIQGSGVLVLPDGRRFKAAFAGSNARPFVGLAKLMRQDGLLDDAHSSGEAIRSWLADHRGPDADAMMQRNPRYVFFKVGPDDGLDPVGAAGVPLPAGRALAMDLSRHSLGELYWIDAEAPALAGAFPTYRRLAAALDTGGAIRGEVRADLYFGVGDDAGRQAGRVRHRLRLYRLVPVGDLPGPSMLSTR